METSSRPRRWQDLSLAQQRAVVAVGLIATIWQLAMLWDLYRRPAEQVRGPKRV